MPTCNECTSPCNCAIEEDGFWANRPQDGRRNVVVEGSGTLLDPITISFMQSEFFRPQATEVMVPSLAVDSGILTEFSSSEFTVTIYQTPHQVLVQSTVLSTQPLAALHNFFMVGASATFPANATGVRQIEIGTRDNTNTENQAIAANIQTAVSTAPSVLTCSGFAPGFLNPDLPGGLIYRKSTPLMVSVYQTSGSQLVVSQIKLWVVMI